ncbi:MAG: IS66 family transposase [Polyangiales bacterium]
MTRDRRDEQIEQLLAQNALLLAEVARLTARVAELEARLRKSSRNSSKPPSSDGPQVPPRPKKPPTGRQPGGQPGHIRHGRPLVPPDKVDKRIVLKPSRCCTCSARLTGTDASPHRHQVFDLPQVLPLVTEYEVHSLTCTCGATTSGELPLGVPTGSFGPSVTAVVALLMGAYRLSKRAVPDLMQDLFGLSMSVGAVVGCQQKASEALKIPVEEAYKAVVEEPIKHSDETGWREARRRAWLWVVVTSRLTVFMVQTRRNADAARRLLGLAVGVLVTDRHGAYNWWPSNLRQFCWAHLIRDFTAIAERGHDSKRIGDALLGEAKRMFHWWHRVRDGTLARSTFRVYMRDLRRRVEALLVEGSVCLHPKTEKTCKKLLASAESLWTFVRVVGVEPTNNLAERAVRHAVLWRRACHAGPPHLRVENSRKDLKPIVRIPPSDFASLRDASGPSGRGSLEE